MASEGAPDDVALARELARVVERARWIPFVTLIEHLERLLQPRSAVGQGGLVGNEAIRFRHDPSLVFHSSDIATVRVHGSQVEVTSTFLGATGSVSPLASFFTEDVLRAASQDGDALGELYDLFHHRLLALCYRAIRRSRLAWSIRKSGDDEFTRRALAVVGLAPKRTRAPLSTVALLGRARILARRPRSLDALEAALALAFPKLRVRIVDFLPRRVRLANEQRLQLGKSNHRLGEETRLGHTMLGQADLLRLCVGPVDRATFDELLPGEAENLRLAALVDAVTGGMLDAEVEIELRRGEEPRAALGRRSRLGRGTLVRRSESTRPLRVVVSLRADPDPASARPRFSTDEE